MARSTGGDQTTRNQTRGESIPAIERATGRAWSDWLSYFESKGAASLGHTEIAKLARSKMPAELQNPDWWAQGTAIAYEQHAGLRVPGQSSSGTFRVSASRTLGVERDTAIAAWIARHGAAEQHLGHEVAQPRTSRTDKRSFYRFSLEGAGRVEIAATPNPKDPAKTTLAVGHEGLADGERIEEWRAHWKQLLAEV